MTDVLGQDEVDALLAAIDQEDSSADGGGGGDSSIQIFSNRKDGIGDLEVRPYDFKRPERVSKDQMQALEQLHEGFGRTFGALLSGFLRTIVEIDVANIEQMTYAEFTQSLPNPTSFNLLTCEPLNGQICLEISPLIIYPIIDRLLGGSNADLFVPQRPMTQIEHRLVSKITDSAVVALGEAWEDIKPIQFLLSETESNPQLVQIVPPNEVVVVVGFEVKMGGRAGTMSLCIPFNVIEPVVENLASQSWSAYKQSQDATSLRHRLEDKLGRAALQTTAVLAETTITMNDLLGMAVGDVVVTEKASTKPVVMNIEGQPKYLANLGQFKGSRALQIRRLIEPADRL